MPSLASPAEMRAYIIERLVGDTGEPDKLNAAATALMVRAVPALVEALSATLSQPVSVEPGAVELIRMAQAKPADPLGYALSVAAGAASPDALVLALDPDTLALLLGCFFGGDPGLPPSPIRRDLSPIEMDVASVVLDAVARGMNGSGPGGLDLRLPLGPALGGTELRKLALRDGPAVRMLLRVSLAGRSCDVCLTMPQRLLLRQGDGKPAGIAGADWGAHFGEEVRRSSLTLQAMMPVGRKTLGELADLAVGDVLEIDDGAQVQATLSARNRTLFLCEFGKLGQNYTLRISQPFDEEQDLLEDLIRK